MPSERLQPQAPLEFAVNANPLLGLKGLPGPVHDAKTSPSRSLVHEKMSSSSSRSQESEALNNTSEFDG